MSLPLSSDLARWRQVLSLVPEKRALAVVGRPSLTELSLSPPSEVVDEMFHAWHGLGDWSRNVEFLSLGGFLQALGHLHGTLGDGTAWLETSGGLARGLESYLGEPFSDYLKELPDLGGRRCGRRLKGLAADIQLAVWEILERHLLEAERGPFAADESAASGASSPRNVLTRSPSRGSDGFGMDFASLLLRRRCAQSLSALAAWRLAAALDGSPWADAAFSLDLLLDVCDRGNVPIGVYGGGHVFLAA